MYWHDYRHKDSFVLPYVVACSLVVLSFDAHVTCSALGSPLKNDPFVLFSYLIFCFEQFFVVTYNVSHSVHFLAHFFTHLHFLLLFSVCCMCVCILVCACVDMHVCGAHSLVCSSMWRPIIDIMGHLLSYSRRQGLSVKPRVLWYGYCSWPP